MKALKEINLWQYYARELEMQMPDASQLLIDEPKWTIPPTDLTPDMIVSLEQVNQNIQDPPKCRADQYSRRSHKTNCGAGSFSTISIQRTLGQP
ncbi:MAG: hypothetical protein M1G31_20775 [Pseudanabaena sp. Salubria-1]|nr:hypothetical protein [Pseudanabaena sp. Salubria-1]